jgi:hypothetical protein
VHRPCTDGLTNTDCAPGGNCLSPSTGKIIIVETQPNVLLDTTQVAHLEWRAGTPDPVTGKASFECGLIWSQPIDLGPIIGVSCIEEFPNPECGDDPERELIDCDGGEPLDWTAEQFHLIGDCGLGDDPNETDPNQLAGPSECRTLCEAKCATLGSDWKVFRASCEGYCNLGLLHNSFCTTNLDCVPNLDGNPSTQTPEEWQAAGECTGGQPVAHSNNCNCWCDHVGGPPSVPGSWVCEIGLRSLSETNAPCDGLDVFQSSRTCNPRTTMTLRAITHDAKAIPGTTLTMPPVRGSPPSCRQFQQGDLSTAVMMGVSISIDGGLGDMFVQTEVHCQGPQFGETDWPTYPFCAGGSEDGLPCGKDADCPGGTCSFGGP